ncbi:MAG: nucleoside triphosphate pyrophosphohydrolase [Acidobacteriota bacterium]|nr:nucleoside triphosphate pyrophosphohydrolase [Acidobacteriota bacterium]
MSKGTIGTLLDIMARLRSPGGCPWDREQTPASLRTYLLEEAFETAEAIDSGDWEHLREELGDLLLQVVFLARIAEEEGHFAFPDVVRTIADKLLRRHPHVFGDERAAEDPAEAWARWEAIKQEERRTQDGTPAAASRIPRVPAHLPALVAAHRLADKAARAGFAWPSAGAALEKVREEVEEADQALADGDPGKLAEEIGDLLFATAGFARQAGVDPEAALASANRKFVSRFQAVEALAGARGEELEELDARRLDALWRQAAGKDGQPEP